MRVPLLSGIVAGPAAEFVATVPLNLEPVVAGKANGISEGQLRLTAGTVQTALGAGRDRGGIVWNDRQYRVLGDTLYEVSPGGVLTSIGNVGGTDVGNIRCNLDYSFDRLIIPSGGDLFYYDGTSLTDVTDGDLKRVIDAIWVDGYTMTTDGTYVVVTELNDPTSVLPLKYGSAESDPDPVTGLLRYREEVYVFGRHTIQTLRNVGGNGFPFAAVRGGTIPYGCVGPGAKCRFGDGYAFVGSARGEALNVFVGGQGTAQSFGSKALCAALARVADETAIEVECRSYGNEQRLLVHLPTESWCFYVAASKAFGEPIWVSLQTDDVRGYRPRNMVEFAGKRWVGDSGGGRFGYLSEESATHWGLFELPWEFEAGLLSNNSAPFVLDSVELVGLPGRGQGEGSVFLSMTRDGETYTTERAITVKVGERTKRIQWRPHCRVSNYIGMKFRGTGKALPGIAAIEAGVRPLR